MRNSLIIFYICLICSSAFSQEGSIDSAQAITSFHSNGQIKTVREVIWIYDSPENNGRYHEYDSTGILRIAGHYTYQNETKECIGCYAMESSDSSFNQYKKSNSTTIRTGIWYFYHANGNIQESGCYSNRVHEVTRLAPDTDNFEPFAEIHYLKHGQWNYYDMNGKPIRIEWYVDGNLVMVKDV
jgi:antitoxin component YwqK of YwqJK toxin-antitoxin module